MSRAQPSDVIGPGGVSLVVSTPDGPVRRGIVVLHEIWGLTASVRAATTRLADAGYAAVAPDLYHRAAVRLPAGGDVRDARRLRATLTVRGIDGDLRGAVGYLADEGVADVGVMGFSMGGTIALWAAARLPIRAAVSVYGGGIVSSRWRGFGTGLSLAAGVRVPWIGFYGDADRAVPVRHVERLRAAIAEAPAATEIIRYAGVRHGFALDASAPDYAPAEAEDVWRRTLAFFDSHL